MACVNLFVANRIGDFIRILQMHFTNGMHLLFYGGLQMKYALRDGIQIDTFSDGEMVIYDSSTETIHVLNAMAALVLRVLINEEDDLVNCFASEVFKFDAGVEMKTLEKDFYNMISDFINANIITVR